MCIRDRYSMDGSVNINLTREQLEEIRSGQGLQILASLQPDQDVVELKERLRLGVETATEAIRPAAEELVRVKHMKEVLQERSDQVVAEISRNVEQHVAALRAREAELVGQVKEFCTAKVDAMREKASLIEERIQVTRDTINTVHSGISEWSDTLELSRLEATLAASFDE
eukprot:TRINITY_DN26292_c0_g1_i1.p1 TRINITY_DN26292_c0_g1~~TRINITY_DN26292_c0_g1_i1.p1  ORF type:complete len:185 (-),score=55.37 TRINITY_DN26292_c0_g1_i1:352-861(-)